ncbi:MAG TPA: helix-turn-helix transcriptional regulator [Pseudonocardiaceae bacterium]|jgi:transcriptional regulator with XRE-family HTH domain|nr:helix-turn-helix transcriptional regulator [Pseudonocardiaceae bacterium]
MATAWSFGGAVRRARQEAGWTQAELGARCGYSASQVSRWESGQQPLRDVALLRQVADLLAIAPEVFGLASADTARPNQPGELAGPRVGRNIPSGEEADPLRRRTFILAAGLAALPGTTANAATAGGQDPTQLLATRLGDALLTTGPDAAPVGAARLRRALTATASDFTSCRYMRLAEQLPPLLAAAEATAEAQRHEPVAQRLLAETYNVTTRALIKLEASGLEWLSADRALRAAWGADDPLVLAEAQRLIASVARRAGDHDRAQSLTLAAAQHLQSGPRPDAEHLAMVGVLYCSAGYAAARAGDRERTHELLDEAARVAQQLEGDHEKYRALSANVVSHRVSAAFILGDAGAALAHAQSLPLAAIPTVERRARMLVDQAMAWARWGKPSLSYRTVLAAERMAPGEVRTRNTARRLVAELLNAKNQAAMRGLPQLAARIHVVG